MITKDTLIEEILGKSPEKARIFVEMGAPCLVCGEPFWGTVKELCEKYQVDVDILLKRLNEEIKGV
ncbi:MAG: disulfide oxidoreductase [candidate division WOR-3 bacterium]